MTLIMVGAFALCVLFFMLGFITGFHDGVDEKCPGCAAAELRTMDREVRS